MTCALSHLQFNASPFLAFPVDGAHEVTELIFQLICLVHCVTFVQTLEKWTIYLSFYSENKKEEQREYFHKVFVELVDTLTVTGFIVNRSHTQVHLHCVFAFLFSNTE